MQSNSFSNHRQYFAEALREFKKCLTIRSTGLAEGSLVNFPLLHEKLKD